MAVERTIFVTGLTGTVGSWIVRDALLRGYGVVALARDASLHTARERVGRVLAAVGVGDRARLVRIVPGDITGDLGALTQGKNRLPDPDCIIHCAAWTSFDEQRSARILAANVEGTRNVLALASALGVPFVQISTAYVAGCRQGTVLESELGTGQSFNNTYERSKCRAEQLVRDWAQESGLPATILRPSIVVGDSVRGRIARFNTLYDFMRAFEVIAKRRTAEGMRVAASPDTTKNLIPVDYVSRAFWRILDHGKPGTYHLTHPAPPTMGELRDIFSRLFGVQRISFVDSSAFLADPPTNVEKLFRKATAVYAPYLVAEPRFDRTNTDAVLNGSDVPPPMDFSFFSVALGFARAAKWSNADCSAQATVPSPGVRKYFDEFLPGKMHREFLPNLKTLTADFRIVLSEPAGWHWTLSIVSGKLEGVTMNGRSYQCSFVLDTPTLQEIIAGRLSPQRAFFSRRVEIEGDLETGLKLATRLAAFFEMFPYEATEANHGQPG